MPKRRSAPGGKQTISKGMGFGGKQFGPFVKMEVAWPEGGCVWRSDGPRGRDRIMQGLGTHVEECGHIIKQWEATEGLSRR